MCELKQATIGQMFAETAKRYSLRAAMEFGGKQWSYAQLDGSTDDIAAGLIALGFRKGDVLGFWCEAEPNTVLLFYAALKIGAVPAMFHPGFREKELRDLAQRCHIRGFAFGGSRGESPVPAVQSLGLPADAVWYIGETAQSQLPDLHSLIRLGKTVPRSVLADAKARVCPADAATLLFTSGTTGDSKIVPDTHFSWVNMGIQQARDLDATCCDRFCVALPVCHCFSISVNLMAALAVGGCLYFPRSRHTEDLLTAISAGKCTIFSSVPALFHALVSRKDLEKFDLSSLRTGFIGGSICTEALFLRISRRLGITLLSSLGQTEATAAITTTTAKDPLTLRARTVGHMIPHVEGKILDLQSGEPLPPGQRGELCIRGYSCMQGYYGDPEATAAAIDPAGFLHTGDVGYFDDAGNLHLTGRRKELIIRGGENISPAEIANVVMQDERVLECQCVGVPDAHYGEEVCLCVRLKPGAELAPEEILARLRESLASYKLPKYIVLLDQFPRTPGGKIRTGALAEQMRQQLGL